MSSVSPRALVRPVLVDGVRWVAAGLVVGAAWALLSPVMRHRSESYEQYLAGDAALAVLTVVAGVGVGAYGLWRRGGPGATTRFLGALGGSVLASVVAWGSGRLLGAPVLVSVAVLLFWPLAIAVVTVLGTLVATLLTREDY